jgi:hypothetical protein
MKTKFLLLSPLILGACATQPEKVASYVVVFGVVIYYTILILHNSKFDE